MRLGSGKIHLHAGTNRSVNLYKASLVPIVRRISLLLILCGFTFTASALNLAARAFQQGQIAERAGDHVKAYLFYAQAAQAAPRNRRYAAKQAALRQSGALQPQTEVLRDPADETAETQLAEEGLLPGASLLPETLPPTRLLASPEKHDFALRGKSRGLFETVAEAYGIRVLFEPEYGEFPNVSVTLSDAGYQEALRAMELATDSFLVPIDKHTAFVARDTPQNRTQWTRVVSIAVPIPERLNAQEAQELATAVQQTLEIRRISMDPTRHAIYFRDAASKVYAAKEMFEILSRARTQISVDVDLLSVSKTSPLAYGLSLPTSSSIVDFGTLPAILKSPAPSTSTGYTPVGGGASLLGIGVGNATALATLGKSSASSVLSAHVTSLDGQAVSFKVGERYPVTTASYSAVNGSPANGGGFTPTVNFIDLGLSLKITPTVHDGGEMTLDVEAEFKSLGSGISNGIPTINNQQYQGKVRLKDGDWAVVAGMVQLTRSGTNTGVSGLARIPLLGNLFGQKTSEVDDNEILIVLKPRLLGDPFLDHAFAGPIWTGTETRPVSFF